MHMKETYLREKIITSCSTFKLRHRLGTRLRRRSQKIWFFFLLKFNMVCTFWIVLMCWCQKWFLKNEKTSLACILARKVIWKAPATTLPNTLSTWIRGLLVIWPAFIAGHILFFTKIIIFLSVNQKIYAYI